MPHGSGAFPTLALDAGDGMMRQQKGSQCNRVT
jgi:hypothetical protein